MLTDNGDVYFQIGAAGGNGGELIEWKSDAASKFKTSYEGIRGTCKAQSHDFVHKRANNQGAKARPMAFKAAKNW